MAVQLSPKLVDEFGPRHQPVTHLLVRVRRLRAAARFVQRRINRQLPVACKVPCVITDGLERSAAHFRDTGWCFIDPFFESSFHSELRAGWPGREYFAPMHNPLKSYDFGFRWLRDKPRTTKYIERFPAMQAAYRMLQSAEFAKRITDFCNDGLVRSCYSMTSTWATAGSALIPHRDSFGEVPHDKATGGFVNFVLLVDANGRAPYAGGTCILGDNEHREVIF